MSQLHTVGLQETSSHKNQGLAGDPVDPNANAKFAQFLGKSLDDPLTEEDVNKLVDFLVSQQPNIPFITDFVKTTLKAYFIGQVGTKIKDLTWSPDVLRAFTAGFSGASGGTGGQKIVDQTSNFFKFLSAENIIRLISIGIGSILLVVGARKITSNA